MKRLVKPTVLALCVAMTPFFALAQEPPAPPPPPPDEVQQPAGPEDRDPALDAQQRALEEQKKVLEDQKRQIERQQRDLERRQAEMKNRLQRRQEQLRDPLFQFRAGPPGAPVLPGSAWLGVELCPVPAALASHLGLENRGVMICNLFPDSPAEQAGLDRYDVIVSADDKSVPGGVEAVPRFSELVRGRKPGDAIRLKVVSHAKEKDVTITLAEAPADLARRRPKYDEDPDVAHLREFGLRGRILRPGPGGWVWEDLGELPGLRERLERRLDPWRSPREKQGPADREGTQEAHRIDKEGNRLQVQRDADGKITVKRFQAGEDKANARVETFDTMDQLREKDREAYDLLQSTNPPPSAPGAPRRPGERPRPPLPPVGPRAPRLPAGPGETPGDEADRAQRWQEWERRFFQGPLRDLKDREGAPEPRPPQPRITFETAPDGKITVHTRDRDAEMSRTFNSRDELREKAPKLFDRYEQLESRMESGQDREPPERER